MRSLSDRRVEHLRSLAAQPDFSQTRYRIVKELARGGMGIVYLAEDTGLNREIAIKVLNTSENDPALASRMTREAQIVARLEHPGIVPVHDVGVLADGRVFYAMKLVRGERLDEYAVHRKSLKDRLKKFQSACDAVAFAHAHGVIHRDLKPQNIMIGSFGEVLVLDWGVAKIVRVRSKTVSREADTLQLPRRRTDDASEDQDVDTAHGTIIGTRGYMSPEQARGEIAALDERADVYSLGAILYFLLTDRPPSATETMPRPRDLNRKITKAAQAVCWKAMARVAPERYAGAAELSAEIARLLDDQPVTAYRENVIERTARWVGKNRFLVLLVLAYLLMRIFFILTARR